MNEAEWLSTTDLRSLLFFASEMKYKRKLRLFSTACVRRILCAYNMEVACLVEAAEHFFDEGIGCLGDLQAMAQTDGIAVYQAPFQLARHDPLLAAIGVVEGILADTDWKEHGCEPVFREIMGNPFRRTEIQLDREIVRLAEKMHTSEANTGALTQALERAGENELRNHLREVSWHPRGCWAVDRILNKRN